MQRLIDYVDIFLSFLIKLILWVINLGNVISTTCQTQSFTPASKSSHHTQFAGHRGLKLSLDLTLFP